MDNSIGNKKTLGGAQPPPDDRSMGETRTMRPDRSGPASRRFAAGDVILGRYRVTDELGQGGMGVVYRCHDETAGIDVALKALPPEVAHNSGEMEEVRANFRLVSKLHHPNIANANMLERDAATGDVYLIMECVDGYDVRQWVRRRKEEGRSLSLDEVTILAYRIAEALDYAHEQGVVHRDIKPSNVRVNFAGEVKVLDFGLAAQLQMSLSRVSQAYHGTSGTGPYMAPEQWQGRRQGAAADQYALAATVYELLGGTPPFENHDTAILREAVLKDAPLPLESVPEHVNAALLRALSKEPAARFASCGEFVKALAGEGKGVRREELSAFGTPADKAVGGTGTVQQGLGLVDDESQRSMGEEPKSGDKGQRKSRLHLLVIGLSTLMLIALVVIKSGLFVPETGRASGVGRVGDQASGRHIQREIPVTACIAEKKNATAESVASEVHDPQPVSAQTIKVSRQTEFLPKQVQNVPLDVQELFTPEFLALTPDERLERVTAKIKQLNPDLIGEISYKKENSEVTEIVLQGTGLKNIWPFRTLTNLNVLKFNCRGRNRSLVDDLSPLRGLRLKILDCSRSAVGDLSPLAEMPLVELRCSNTKVSDLSALRGMKLTVLAFSHTEVADLSPLVGMPLQTLECDFCPVNDLSSLRDMRLAALSCGGKNIHDLSPLVGMPLQTLQIGGSRVSDLSPLRGMKLVRFDCGGSKVYDLSPLTGMPLEWLRMGRSLVADLTPLVGMPLATLTFPNTLVTNIAPVKEMRKLRQLSFDFVTERDSAILRPLKSIVRINHIQVDDFWKRVDAGDPPQPGKENDNDAEL